MKVGDQVKKAGIVPSSTNGRIGKIIEGPSNRNRFRVHWHSEFYGEPISIRTWVNGKYLQIIN